MSDPKPRTLGQLFSASLVRSFVGALELVASAKEELIVALDLLWHSAAGWDDTVIECHRTGEEYDNRVFRWDAQARMKRFKAFYEPVHGLSDEGAQAALAIFTAVAKGKQPFAVEFDKALSHAFAKHFLKESWEEDARLALEEALLEFRVDCVQRTLGVAAPDTSEYAFADKVRTTLVEKISDSVAREKALSGLSVFFRQFFNLPSAHERDLGTQQRRHEREFGSMTARAMKRYNIV